MVVCSTSVVVYFTLTPRTAVSSIGWVMAWFRSPGLSSSAACTLLLSLRGRQRKLVSIRLLLKRSTVCLISQYPELCGWSELTPLGHLVNVLLRTSATSIWNKFQSLSWGNEWRCGAVSLSEQRTASKAACVQSRRLFRYQNTLLMPAHQAH